ncbi:translation initiation factor eIF-3b [Dissoconium aciculare CBS 342.82]|uniref:Eukaryotic translation initiation factor 3 subunit B n=1 Tax=Dissoconium aciculare CBS 342.82 TaxID=1314786 RepID=A0A6J3M7H3_9PEZI|nr:translation initiation factor eIF-3b [Dissoconium aciculare CBS 342.82]KAF1824011.1 translation initiation factor eIF-3b [Dissoconium aciculare CBS 342.82]
MAPSFEQLERETELDDDEEEIDFSDLRAQYETNMEEGLDTFVVVDGLPKVPAASKEKLIKFLLRSLTKWGTTSEDNVFMPVDDSGTTEGFAFVEYATPAQAATAVKNLHATPLDKKHTIAVNKLTDIERYGREGRINETYDEPEIPPFEEKEHLRWWLGDADGRDQFVMYRGDNVGVYWNEREGQPDSIVDRAHWTETFVRWSPKGTYLTSMHNQGVQLWGGPNWSRQKRFMHPGVNLVDFSPDERFMTTWSHAPMQVEEGNPILSLEEDGKNYIIWDVATAKPLRSFVTLDLPGPTNDSEGNPIKKKIQWPAFKWSADSKYVARMNPGQSISVYELPRMNLMKKTSIKIEGVVDFEWSPSNPQRDNIKEYEQLLCYWTPELGSNPAKVGLMSIPSEEIVRTRNLFNVSDAKLHWQSESAFVCIKVDRHSKSKKSMATNLEIFRVKEKGVPVEVVDSLKDTVINFAWEPKGDRFVIITAGEVPQGSQIPPKTAVSFFAPEKAKGNAVGNFKLIRTIDKKNNNAIHWSPNGRFVIVATVLSQQGYDLDFWDFDFEGEKDEKEKDLTANLQLMGTADHYGVTDIEWDPSGRFVATSASVWKHRMENGYHLYSFAGQLLREEPIEQFKQWTWRPRPERLLSKEEIKNVRKNLREYSRAFEEADLAKRSTADRAVIEGRRRQLDEWLAWRQTTTEELSEEREDLGLPEFSEERRALIIDEQAGENEGKVVEEIFEEILEESEEILD